MRVLTVVLLLMAVGVLALGAPRLACPNGHQIGAAWKFCETCGARLGPPPAPPKPRTITKRAQASTPKGRSKPKDAAAQAVREAAQNAVAGAFRDELERTGVSVDRRVAGLLARLHSEGLILNERIGRQEARPDGFTHVQVVVEINAERLRGIVASDSGAAKPVVVILPEFVDGKLRPDAIVESEVLSSLVAQDHLVLAAPQIQRATWEEAVSAAIEKRAVRVTGLIKLDAPALVLTGRAEAKFSQNNEGIISAHAMVQLRAIDTATGQLIMAKDFRHVRGFGPNIERAAEDALKRGGEQAADFVSNQLAARTRRQPVQVTLVAQDVGANETWVKLLGELRRIPVVQSIGEARFDPRESEAELVCTGSALGCAAAVDALPAWRVSRYAEATIMLEAEPEEEG